MPASSCNFDESKADTEAADRFQYQQVAMQTFMAAAASLFMSDQRLHDAGLGGLLWLFVVDHVCRLNDVRLQADSMNFLIHDTDTA
jgi:hypothetical protein